MLPISGRVHVIDDRVGVAVREYVSDRIAQVRPDVVIAHSLGTRVAIDALAALQPEVQPRLLLTLGSPLGIAPMHPDSVLTHDWLHENPV